MSMLILTLTYFLTCPHICHLNIQFLKNLLKIQKGIKIIWKILMIHHQIMKLLMTNTTEVPCTSFLSSTSLLSLGINHCSGHYIWCIHVFLHTFCTMYISLNNSYHFTTCFVNWLYVWIHTCWHIWYIIHMVETVLTKYILCASLCSLALGLESLDCECKGSVSQVGIRQWKATSLTFPSLVNP